ncbi:PREDICTED: serine/threonine-protein phosphatase 7 long form homolog [Lupinus angustifolius]|uniref:serine/threonine-protein phosphatase 7 long form homolog n=1 Tax=Lupinus angustifolius TaxID=3871 RepID=UPI00092F3862|nr:PREDICTED: serine/threonine-protein phosphatase 7 long form homolog [Lupinus angustifolius]
MEHIGSGPINPSLLTLQKNHVSTNIWNGGEVTFRAMYNFWQNLPSAPVLEVIRNTTFGHIIDIGTIEINNHLITALVEKWRPETHTFHLPVGECTVTLEDVTYQLGLPINGAPVTGIASGNWEMICHNLLGAIPTDKQIMGQRIQMSWLDSTFAVLPPHADDVVIEQHARGMIGGFLMPDTSGSRVHLMYLPLLEDLSQTFQYSWGSAVLACLYRGICRAALISHQIEIGGCLHLLQSWAYDRIPMLAPRVGATSNHTNIHGHATNIIRSMLDRLRIDQFVWTPYRNITYVGPIHDLVRARVPLICFALVEWHDADRVMRQFGLQQPIPEDQINLEKQHKMNLRWKNDYNWPQKHDQWIQVWNNRENYVVNGFPDNQLLYRYSQYMQWYLQRTRKYISPDGAYSAGSYNFIKMIRDRCAPTNVFPNPLQSLNDVYHNCNEMMQAFAQLIPTAFSSTTSQAPPPQQFQMSFAPDYQQHYESQTHTDTFPQAYTQTLAPQQQQQHPFGF